MTIHEFLTIANGLGEIRILADDLNEGEATEIFHGNYMDAPWHSTCDEFLSITLDLDGTVVFVLKTA